MDIFQQVDKDGSGEIDIDELADMLLLDDLSDALGTTRPHNKTEALVLSNIIMNKFASQTSSSNEHGFGFDHWDEFLICLQEIVGGGNTNTNTNLDTNTNTSSIAQANSSKDNFDSESEDDGWHDPSPHPYRKASGSLLDPHSTANPVKNKTSKNKNKNKKKTQRRRRHSVFVTSTSTVKNNTNNTKTSKKSDKQSSLVMRYQFEALQASQEAISERKKRQELEEKMFAMKLKLETDLERKNRLKYENNELKRTARAQASEADAHIDELEQELRRMKTRVQTNEEQRSREYERLLVKAKKEAAYESENMKRETLELHQLRAEAAEAGRFAKDESRRIHIGRKFRKGAEKIVTAANENEQDKEKGKGKKEENNNNKGLDDEIVMLPVSKVKRDNGKDNDKDEAGLDIMLCPGTAMENIGEKTSLMTMVEKNGSLSESSNEIRNGECCIGCSIV